MSGSTGGIMTMTAPILMAHLYLHRPSLRRCSSNFILPSSRKTTRSTPSMVSSTIHSGSEDWPAASRVAVLSLWESLSASLTRTFFYSGVRFGMYEKLKEMGSTSTHAPSGLALALMAASSGFTGSVCSNFADVVCLRMQADPGLPQNCVAITRTSQTVCTRWSAPKAGTASGLVIVLNRLSTTLTGVWLGAGRAAIGTATQLAGYDIIKRELMKRTSLGDNIPTHIAASCLAGFLSTFICSPLDVFKARFMTRKSSAHSMSVMLQSTLKNEGAAWMFKGLTPALISRAPSTIITFVTLEQLRKVYRHMHGLQE
ncbi:unnamed protein product [Aureobasidium pullulans]|nr:unnamed protein product [Aureobasidium pullulans]